jgi:hypothetical protein
LTFRLRECPYGHQLRTLEVDARLFFDVADYTGVLRSENLLASVTKSLTAAAAAGRLHSMAAAAAIREARNDERR